MMQFQADQEEIENENHEITENLIPQNSNDNNTGGVLLPGGAVVGEVFFNNEPQVEEDIEYDDSKPKHGGDDDEFNEETRLTVDATANAYSNKIRPMTMCWSIVVFLLSLLITIVSVLDGILAIIGLFNIAHDIQVAKIDNGWGNTQWGVVVSRIVMLLPPFVGIFVGPIGIFQACVVMCTNQAMKLKLCWAGLYFVGLLFLVLSYMFSFSTTTLFDIGISGFTPQTNIATNPYLVWAGKIFTAIVVSIITFACCGICCFPCSVAQMFAIELEMKRPSMVAL